MKILIRYKNGDNEIVSVEEKKLENKGWKNYILEHYKNVEDAYCNLTESLKNGKIADHYHGIIVFDGSND